MDVLAATGLVNHFGRVQENDNITVTPILLRKGTTKLALYGLANVRDERLFRTFREGFVKFLRPSQGSDEWFNLMTVHQNHTAHTSTGYLPETFLPDFMNLVIWGHEHDCIPEPVKNPNTGFSVLQPGSSVATSLIEGESLPKYSFILKIKGKEFSVEKIRLMTVRPFAIDSVSLANDSGITPAASRRPEITQWLNTKVEELIKKALEDWKQIQSNINTTQDPPLPLIRLKVDYSGGYEVENPRRFSNKFVQRVANVNDVVSFHRKRATTTNSHNNGVSSNHKIPTTSENGLEKVKVQSLVKEFLKDNDLQLLPENGLGDAVKDFVEKDDKEALKAFVNNSLDIQLNTLLKIDDLDEKTLPTEMNKAKRLLVLEAQKRSIPQHHEISNAKGTIETTSSNESGKPEEENSEEDEDILDNIVSQERPVTTSTQRTRQGIKPRVRNTTTKKIAARKETAGSTPETRSTSQTLKRGRKNAKTPDYFGESDENIISETEKDTTKEKNDEIIISSDEEIHSTLPMKQKSSTKNATISAALRQRNKPIETSKRGSKTTSKNRYLDDLTKNYTVDDSSTTHVSRDGLRSNTAGKNTTNTDTIVMSTRTTKNTEGINQRLSKSDASTYLRARAINNSNNGKSARSISAKRKRGPAEPQKTVSKNSQTIELVSFHRKKPNRIIIEFKTNTFFFINKTKQDLDEDEDDGFS